MAARIGPGLAIPSPRMAATPRDMLSYQPENAQLHGSCDDLGRTRRSSPVRLTSGLLSRRGGVDLVTASLPYCYPPQQTWRRQLLCEAMSWEYVAGHNNPRGGWCTRVLSPLAPRNRTPKSTRSTGTGPYLRRPHLHRPYLHRHFMPSVRGGTPHRKDRRCVKASVCWP